MRSELPIDHMSAIRFDRVVRTLSKFGKPPCHLPQSAMIDGIVPDDETGFRLKLRGQEDTATVYAYLSPTELLQTYEVSRDIPVSKEYVMMFLNELLKRYPPSHNYINANSVDDDPFTLIDL